MDGGTTRTAGTAGTGAGTADTAMFGSILDGIAPTMVLIQGARDWLAQPVTDRVDWIAGSIVPRDQIEADRICRGAAIAAAEWETIPRRDEDRGDAIGVVHLHGTYLPCFGEPRCDCADHLHRRELHGGWCKHAWAAELVSLVEATDRAARRVLGDAPGTALDAVA